MSNNRRRYLDRMSPKKVNGQLAYATEFYRSRLWLKVQGLFDVELPEEWNYNYFMSCLLRNGVVAICDSPIGVMPFRCSTYGINYMNLPTMVNVAVPTLMSFTRTLGVDAEIVYLNLEPTRGYYYRYNSIIDKYAVQLATVDCCTDVNLFNSKGAAIAVAETKAQAETYKKAYDDVQDGNPLVVVAGSSLDMKAFTMFFNHLSENFIVDKLQDAKRTIMNEFLTEIGVNNANTDKKERLITSEVSANNQELTVNTDVIARNLEDCVKKVRKTFGLTDFNINLKYRERMEEDYELNRVAESMGRTEPDNRLLGGDGVSQRNGQ